MALVVITSAAVTAPATAAAAAGAAAAVVLTLCRTWHNLQAQAGGRSGAADVGGGIQYDTWTLNHASNCNIFSYL